MRTRLILFLLKYWFRWFPKGFIYFGHGISSTIEDPHIERIHLPTSDLTYILDFWKSLDFEFVSMQKLMEIKDNKFKHHKPWIHLTLDDGYRNNLTEALPILAERNIPFTVFVSTGMVSQSKRFDTFKIRTAIWFTEGDVNIPRINAHLNAKADGKTKKEFIYKISKTYKQLNQQEAKEFMSSIESLLSNEQWETINRKYTNDAPLSIDELVELSEHPLVCIGAHGVDHAIHNKNLEEPVREEEIYGSKRWLEKTVGQNINCFAFPNGGVGDIDETSKKLCKKAGYQMVFTTQMDPINENTDPYHTPRHFLSTYPQDIVRFLLFNK